MVKKHFVQKMSFKQNKETKQLWWRGRSKMAFSVGKKHIQSLKLHEVKRKWTSNAGAKRRESIMKQRGETGRHRHWVQSQNKSKEERRRDLISETKRILRVKINNFLLALSHLCL